MNEISIIKHVNGHSYIFILLNCTIFRPELFRSSSDTNERYGWRCCADAISILTSHHCNVFSRMCASIGFKKLVVTYWPSSWFKPWSLCGDVCWSWISNASRTFLSNFLSSVYLTQVFNQIFNQVILLR